MPGRAPGGDERDTLASANQSDNRRAAVVAFDGATAAAAAVRVASPVALPASDYTGSTDVSVRIEGGRLLHLHRALLMARCDFFRAMLGGPFREAQRGCLIDLGADVDLLSFTCVLRYLYTDVLPPAHLLDELALPTLVLAQRFGIPRLSALLQRHVGAHICTENVCDVLLFADAHGATPLRAAAIRHIVAHWSTVHDTLPFIALPQSVRLLLWARRRQARAREAALSALLALEARSAAAVASPALDDALRDGHAAAGAAQQVQADALHVAAVAVAAAAAVAAVVVVEAPRAVAQMPATDVLAAASQVADVERVSQDATASAGVAMPAAAPANRLGAGCIITRGELSSASPPVAPPAPSVPRLGSRRSAQSGGVDAAGHATGSTSHVPSSAVAATSAVARQRLALRAPLVISASSAVAARVESQQRQQQWQQQQQQQQLKHK